MVNRILQGIENPCFFDRFMPQSMTGQSCWVKTIYIIGLIIVVRLLIKIIYSVWDFWLAPKNLGHITTRFGLGSYVVITGTTAGIGKSLAKDFVALGFNIVQISRNAEKLAKVELELKAINPHVKVVTCVLDLAKSNQKGFFDGLKAQTKDLDISILVNNAGIDSIELFHEMETDFIQDTININVTAVTLLTKAFISQLNDRNKPSAVLCLSSLAGVKPMSYFSAYCATKAFVEMFCQSMNKEHPRIQFMSVRPSEVSTQMTFYKPKDIFTISSSECTQSILRELSRGVTSTNAHWNHKMQEWLYKIVPEFIFDIVWEKFVVNDFRKSRGLSPATKIT